MWYIQTPNARKDSKHNESSAVTERGGKVHIYFSLETKSLPATPPPFPSVQSGTYEVRSKNNVCFSFTFVGADWALGCLFSGLRGTYTVYGLWM